MYVPISYVTSYLRFMYYPQQFILKFLQSLCFSISFPRKIIVFQLYNSQFDKLSIMLLHELTMIQRDCIL
jgi:hypothetical protein